MDEMTEYRERIERRMSGRRAKNDRRHTAHAEAPKFFDWMFVSQVLFLVLLYVMLFLTDYGRGL